MKDRPAERRIRRDTTGIWAQIDMDAVLFNMESMRANIREDVKIVAVLKTNGYGHGAVAIMKELEKLPYVWGYAAATFEEAKELRENGAKKPVILLGYVFPYCYRELARLEIRPACFREDMLEQLSAAAAAEEKPVLIQIAVDTGMGRIGIRPDDEGLRFVRKALGTPGVTVEGMFTHFAKADEAEHGPTHRQIRIYSEFRETDPVGTGIQDPSVPLLEQRGDRRIQGGEHGPCARRHHALRTVAFRRSKPVDRSLKACHDAVFTDRIYQGSRTRCKRKLRRDIYYNREKTRIATVPVGYGDGYPRSLSGKGYVLVCGRKAPILGRVCMDQMMVDVTDIPEAREGSLCTLIGTDGEETITMEELGDLSGRFNYELACDISARVPRIVCGGTERLS